MSTRAPATRRGRRTSGQGARRSRLLARIALAPKAKWYGQWIPKNQITAKVRDHIANAQAGDPEALVQMTVFRLKPWEEEACRRLPTAKEQRDYTKWIDKFAAGIGAAHVALVLQPDGPFALCAPGGSQLPSQLIGYASHVFSALPNVSVYIDAGASDWLRDDPAKALKILVPAGIDTARGFALNSTHYASTSAEIAFGTAVVQALAAAGYADKHFVVNTASNGAPFNGYDYHGPNFDNAATCKTRASRRASPSVSRRPQTSPTRRGHSRRPTRPTRRRTSTATCGSAGPGCTCRPTRSTSSGRSRSRRPRPTESDRCSAERSSVRFFATPTSRIAWSTV